jgi:hypothetical protein
MPLTARAYPRVVVRREIVTLRIAPSGRRIERTRRPAAEGTGRTGPSTARSPRGLTADAGTNSVPAGQRRTPATGPPSRPIATAARGNPNTAMRPPTSGSTCGSPAAPARRSRPPSQQRRGGPAQPRSSLTRRCRSPTNPPRRSRPSQSRRSKPGTRHRVRFPESPAPATTPSRPLGLLRHRRARPPGPAPVARSLPSLPADRVQPTPQDHSRHASASPVVEEEGHRSSPGIAAGAYCPAWGNARGRSR